MSRVKTFDSTGISPGGVLFAGDLNNIQDHYADLVNLSQSLSVGSLSIGEAGLSLTRFATGILRLSGQLRVDSVVNAITGFQVNGSPLASTHLSDSAQLARLANPAFSGIPTAPNPSVGDSSTRIATTSFVAALVGAVAIPGTPTKVVLSGSGNYNKPTACRAIFVECVGGGGTGGTAQTGSQNVYAVGSGGWGGAYAAKLIASPAASYTYQVGAGGAAIASGSTAPRSNAGGDTVFGANIVVAKGGPGGNGDNNSTPSHGIPYGNSIGNVAAGNVGDIIIPNGRPGSGYIVASGVLIVGEGGKGAGPYGADGGYAALTAGNSSGTSPYGYGGGSSGSSAGPFSAGDVGVNAGNSGIIIITEFY